MLLTKAIFRFNLNQNRKASGLSKEARSKRRQRNLISMKFNIINWALESVMLLLTSSLYNRCRYYYNVMNDTDQEQKVHELHKCCRWINLLYIAVSCCGTPIVYFMAIEDNRKKARDYYKV